MSASISILSKFVFMISIPPLNDNAKYVDKKVLGNLRISQLYNCDVASWNVRAVLLFCLQVPAPQVMCHK
jgi:hypothetical protein